jgi:hypothetical protein
VLFVRVRVLLRARRHARVFDNAVIHPAGLRSYSQLEAIGSATAEERARAILRGLQFVPSMVDAPVAALSGGWRMRVALAQARAEPRGLAGRTCAHACTRVSLARTPRHAKRTDLEVGGFMRFVRAYKCMHTHLCTRTLAHARIHAQTLTHARARARTHTTHARTHMHMRCAGAV